MRDTRAYLLTTAVAASASIALIFSLLALGADFGANVWPHVGGGGDDGRRIALLQPPPAPPRSVFGAPARLTVPLTPIVEPRAPVLTPVIRDDGPALGDGDRATRERGTGRSGRPTRTSPPPAPAPAPVPPAAVVPTPIAPVAAVTDDDDDEARSGDGDRVADTARGRPGRGNAFGRQSDNAGKPKRGNNVAPTPVVPGPGPAVTGEGSDEDEGDDGGDHRKGRGAGRWHDSGHSNGGHGKAKGGR